MVERKANEIYFGDLSRDSGKVDKIVIGTEKRKDGRYIAPVVLTGSEIKNLPKWAIEKKISDAGFDPSSLHRDIDKFYVKPEGKSGEKEAQRAALSALATKLEWNKKSQFDSFVKSVGSGKIKMGATKSSVDDSFIRKYIWGETANPEFKAMDAVSKKAHDNLSRTLSHKELEEKLAGVSPETGWFKQTKKRYKDVEGVKQYLLKKNMSLKRKGYENDKVNMALKQFITKEEADAAVDPFIHNTKYKQDGVLERVANIKNPYTNEQLSKFERDAGLEQKVKQLDTHQNRVFLAAYADSYLGGTRDSKRILDHAAKHPKQYADTVQLVLQKSELGKGISTATAQRNINVVTGLAVPLKLEKREKMPEIGKKELEKQFRKSLGETLGMTQYDRFKPLIKYSMNVASEEEIAAVATGKMSAEDFIRNHPVEYEELYRITGKKPQPRTYEKWQSAGGQVLNEPMESDYEPRGESRGRGRPVGSTRSAKKDGIIRRSRGGFVTEGRPLFSRKTAVEKKGGFGYEMATQRGSLSPFKSAEEKKTEFKEVRADVNKMGEDLKKKGLPGLTQTEKHRLESKWTESGRERLFEKLMRQKEEKKEKVQRTAERYASAGGKEAALLALPKREGGYSWFSKLRRKRRAEKMRSDESYRQKMIARDTERESIWTYQAKKATRKAAEREKIAGSKFWTGWAQMKQTTKWAIIVVCAVALLFIPMGLFYVVGWAMAVALVTLIQFIVWVFISVWFLLAQGAVSVIGGLGQIFIGGINAISQAITGWMGQPYQPFNWQWIQNMPMFKQDASGNWILLTYTDAYGRRQTLTWGMANLVPPSFLKLDLFMPKTFDTSPIIAHIVPALKTWFEWFYGPMANMYTNWIQTQEWYIVGLTAGAPIVVSLIIIGIVYWYYREKVKPRMY
jgi:hypothetical protein